jgi:cytochrome P450
MGRGNLFGVDRSVGRSMRQEASLTAHQAPGNPNPTTARSGEEWRALRLAWQPAFQSGSLERYSKLMDACALQFCDKLAPAAAEGRPIDVWRAIGAMTMGVSHDLVLGGYEVR